MQFHKVIQLPNGRRFQFTGFFPALQIVVVLLLVLTCVRFVTPSFTPDSRSISNKTHERHTSGCSRSMFSEWYHSPRASGQPQISFSSWSQDSLSSAARLIQYKRYEKPPCAAPSKSYFGTVVVMSCQCCPAGAFPKIRRVPVPATSVLSRKLLYCPFTRPTDRHTGGASFSPREGSKILQ
jgi:hypothetical protein